MKRKEYIVFFILCFLVLIAGLHERYIGSGVRYDIFLFYDYPKGRYLSNIIYDLSGLITRTSLLFIAYYISNTRMLKKIFLPFLFISIADIIDYLLFFQKSAHIKLGVLLLLILLFIYPNILKRKK